LPFKSEKQKKFLFANKPKLAKRWSQKYNKGATLKKKSKIGYKAGESVKKKWTPLDLDALLIKRKKIDAQIEMAKKRKWIKGRPSGVQLTGSKKYVKKGGKV